MHNSFTKNLFILFVGLFYILLTSHLFAAPEENPFEVQLTSDEEHITRFLDTPHFPTLAEMYKQRYIRALVVYSKTDFFFDKGHSKGIQIEYLKGLEKFLNKNIKKENNKIHILFIPVSFSELIPSLLEGKGDIAATYLTLTPKRQEKIAFASGGKMNVSELIVSHKDALPINHSDDLSGKLVYVLKGSSYVEHLEELNEEFRERFMSPIRIMSADTNLLAEDILEMVNSGIVKYTVVDDYIAYLWSKIFPNIRFSQEIAISTNNKIGWALRKNNKALQEKITQFAQGYKQGTLLGNILFKRYFKNTKWIRNPNTDKELLKTRKFLEIFKRYGFQYQFDYLALIAQAYQESGLDHSKVSPKGAVGIMQLLPSTAADKNIGFNDISSIENNIHAGAKYLAFIRNRYYSKDEILPMAKFAFSWAAYNAGPAKVERMRQLAEKMGLDPNRWFNHVEIAAGKIVGRETVKYVANIYKYYITYKLAFAEAE